MSQLQVTGEAKIRDLQGPVVANAGVITALDGAANQYVRGDGTLASFPTSGGGGSSVSYYLNGSVNQGTFAGSTYYEMGEDAITGTGTNFSTSTDGLLAQFITDAGVPDVTQIPSGNWNVEFFMGVSASSGALASFYVEIYKWDGSTFTLIATNAATPEFLTNTTTVDAYFTSVAMPTTTLAVTDRLAIRIYANVASKTVTLYTEDNRLCQVVTTFSKGMLSLNNLTDQSQYLTVGTAGTDFNIVSSGDTHTFNIPSASATNRGLITTGTQTIAGSKTFTGLNTFANDIIIDNGVSGNTLSFKQYSSGVTGGVGYTSLYAQGSDTLGINFGNIEEVLLSNSLLTTIRQYQFPDLSGTFALLEGSQTFTGSNTFDGYGIFNLSQLLKFNPTFPTTPAAGYLGVRAEQSGVINSLNLWDGTTYNTAKLSFDNTSSYTYTFPAATGTIALTSNLSSYVPYTGATGNVNIGNNHYYGGTILLKQDVASASATGYFSISGSTGTGTAGLVLGLGSGTTSNMAYPTSGNYSYVFPAISGTLALLEGSQTFTGEKVFNNNALFNSVLSVNYGAWLQKGTPTATFSSVFTTLYSEVGAINAVFRDNTNQAKLQFQAASNYTYTFPASSGTVALTSNIPTVSGTTNYIPKFTGTNSIGNSSIQDDGSNISINGFTVGYYSTTLKINNSSLSSGIAFTQGNLLKNEIYSYNDDLYIGSISGNIYFATLGGIRAMINNAGRLLLGTTADNGSLLQVAGSATFSSSVQATNMSIGIAPQTDKLFVYNASGTNTGITIQQDGTGDIFRANGNGGANRFNITQSGAATFSSSVTATNLYLGSLTNEQMMISGTGSRGIGVSTITSGDPFVRLYDNTTIKADMWWDRAGGFMGINSLGAGSKTCINPFGGNVGIGTNSPSGKLSLYDTTDLWINISRGSSFVNIGVDSTGTFYNTNSNHRWLYNSGSNEAMRITSGGNVGIGTSSPDRALTVNGQIGLNSDFVSTKGGTTFRLGYEAYTSTGGVNMFTESAIPLVLGTSSTERMRITSGGSIGMGITSPAAKLHVEGLNNLHLSNASGNVNVDFSSFGVSTSYPQARIQLTDGGFYGGYLLFYTKANGASTNPLVERLRLTDNGTLGFNGNGDVNNASGVDKLSIGYLNSNYGWIQTWNSTSLYLNKSGNAVYAGTQRIDNNSDARIKENIASIENALDVVLSLNGRKFNMLDEDNILRYGFIAQEVEPHLADFVTKSDRKFEKGDVKIENLLTLESSGAAWGALLVEAIKQQQQQIEELKSLIAAK